MTRTLPITPLERTLLFTGIGAWIIAAIDPVDRATWLLENILLAVAVLWIFYTYRKWRLSPSSYSLIFIFFVVHVLGAHYTYSVTPVGHWLDILFGAGRNHYDRVVHFLFGLLLVSPFRDQVEQATTLTTRTAWGVSVLIITSLSTAYELTEWLIAEIVNPIDAGAFLGLQGDIFDAQKDMGLAVLGALIGLALAEFLRRLRTFTIERRQRDVFPSHAEPHLVAFWRAIKNLRTRS